MGAVPKKKPSLTRQRHRKTAWMNSFKLPHYQPCPDCEGLKMQHRACTHCGKYNGRQVLEPKTYSYNRSCSIKNQ